MADIDVSKASARKGVRVRIPLPAQRILSPQIFVPRPRIEVAAAPRPRSSSGNAGGMWDGGVMYPQATVDTALRLSAIGVLDKENAQICGVSVAAIRHWRAGRRHVASGMAAARKITCPRCHPRPVDEPPYAYLLGLYLGDGHIARGPRDVYALTIACCDDWPGLRAAARQAMATVMPTSRVSFVQQTGCTMVKSYSKHWTCLFPQHGPGRKHQRKTELEQWQDAIVREFPDEFARGLFIPMAGAARIGYGEGLPMVTTGTSIRDIFLRTSPPTFSGCAVRPWTGWGWPGVFRDGILYPWPGARRWRGSMSSSAPSTE